MSRGVTITREYFNANDPTTPITEAKVGDTVSIRLTINALQDLYYFVLEDPLPAGFESINPRLANAPRSANDPAWNWGWWQIDHMELRDAQTNFYADFLPRGTYVFTYRAQVSLAGEFQIMPTQGYTFYQPEIFGRTNGLIFQVQEGLVIP